MQLVKLILYKKPTARDWDWDSTDEEDIQQEQGVEEEDDVVVDEEEKDVQSDNSRDSQIPGTSSAETITLPLGESMDSRAVPNSTF